MPFKDINLQELNKSLEATQKFNRNTAIINAQQKGDINKLELLTGKEIITADPIAEALFETTPIGKKLTTLKPEPNDYKKFGKKVAKNIPAIDYDKLAKTQLDIDESIPSAGDKLKASTLDKDYTQEFYDKHKLPKISEVYADKQKVSDLKKVIKSKQMSYAAAVRYGTFQPEDEPLKKMLTKYNQQLNKAYKEQENYQEGLGLTKQTKLTKLQYGKYVIDMQKLKKSNILSISYPNNKKVNGFPNIMVSDSVKQILLNNKINKNYNLTNTEKEYLRSFFEKSGADNLSTSKKKIIGGKLQPLVGGCSKVYFTDEDNLKERYQVLLGIWAGGNNSIEVFNELNGIADILFQKGYLTEEQLKKISKLNI